MANQPRLRPWSRLASLRSVSDPAPPQSQNQKLINSPPPPSKLNVNTEIEHKNIPVEQEPKTMLVNKTTEKPIGNGNGNSLQKVLNKKPSDNSEESGIRVITIAGENKGAYMQIMQTRKKPNHHNKMANSEMKKGYDYESEKSVSGEGNASYRKDKSEKVMRTTLSSPPRNGVYINSNVQCVNNSLLLHTSCTHSDPGVHLTLSNKAFGEGFHLKERVDN